MKNSVTADYLLTDCDNSHTIVTAHFERVEDFDETYWRVEWKSGYVTYAGEIHDADEVRGGRLSGGELERFGATIAEVEGTGEKVVCLGPIGM